MELFSKYLTREAAEKTRSGLPNRIPDELLPNVIWFGENIVDPIMDYFKFPDLAWLYILYRSLLVNKLAGSGPSSWHPLAAAGDIKTIGLMKVPTQSQIFYFIVNNLKFNKIIWEKGGLYEPQWIHVQGKPGDNSKIITLYYMKDGRVPTYTHSKTLEGFEKLKRSVYEK